jgi:hypothetical protein
MRGYFWHRASGCASDHNDANHERAIGESTWSWARTGLRALAQSTATGAFVGAVAGLAANLEAGCRGAPHPNKVITSFLE